MRDYINIFIIQNYRKKKRKRRVPGEYRGENIDKIKTPCFCLFKWAGKERLGSITNARFKRDGKQSMPWYALTDLSNQTEKEVGDLVFYSPSLKKLIRKYEVRIVKVKIKAVDNIDCEQFPSEMEEIFNCRCSNPININFTSDTPINIDFMEETRCYPKKTI